MPTSVAVSLPDGGIPLPAPGVPSAGWASFGGSVARPDRAARARLERRAGSLLRSMRDGEVYRPLGFARLADYVPERLGVSLRGAQEMMRVDEGLEALPANAAAFEAGEITAGHVRLLTRVATPDDEAYWVACARRMRVKDLARAVAAVREQEGEAGGLDAGTSGLPGAGVGGAGGALGVPGIGPVQAGAFGDTASRPGVLGSDEDPDERVRYDVPAPAWVSDWWRETAVLVRHLAGSALPPGEAFGIVVAEVASGGVGTGYAPGVVSPEGDVAQPGAFTGLPGSASSPCTDLNVDPDAAEQPPAGSENSGLPPSAPSPATTPTPLEARALDRDLRAIFSERRRQEALLAEHLSLVGVGRSYRNEGFKSLEEYASEKFSLSPRTLYRLLALHRSFERLPMLRRTFIRGRLTARQTVLVGSVATCLTLDPWMRRAEAVALKRLEDEVDFYLHLEETRPAVWHKLEGLPLPEDLALAPGRAPRLPSSARASETNPEAGPASTTAPVSAAALLRALQEDEAATPLPERMTVIKLWLEPAVRDQWLEMLEAMRTSRGEGLEEWQALVLILKEFSMVWDNAQTRRQRRDNPILERDGWRCMVPWCRSVGTGRLHVHHIVPRAQGGPDEPWNLVTLCVGCHLGLLHEGHIRVTGRAPDDLVWELGLEPGLEPFAVFHGHVKVSCVND